MVETSSLMKGMQQGTLRSILERFEGSSNIKLEWYDTLENIPRQEDVFTILVAHEFFDALPFHLIRVCRADRFFLILYVSYTHTRELRRVGTKSC